MRLLIVTAVDAERDAVRDGLVRAGAADTERVPLPDRAADAGRDGPVRPGDVSGSRLFAGTGCAVRTVGVGPAAAAAGTAWLLATARAEGTMPDAVICAGIAGGFAGRIPVGGTALATASVAADLGVQDPAAPDGFRTVDELGFGRNRAGVDTALLAALSRALPWATAGEILTVSTVTGTAASTALLAARHPDAIAEAMEGFGAAAAAGLAGTAFAEVRTVSNMIGPRDRAGWRIGAALDALTEVGAALGGLGRLAG